MALADALKRFNNSLKEAFHVKSFDPAPGRAKLKRAIENARTQFGTKPPSKAPNKLWKLGQNEAVEFTLRLNGNVIPLNGEDSNTLPEPEFLPFLDELEAAIEAKELDAEIKTAMENKPAASVTARATTTRKARGSTSKPSTSKLPARADGLPHRPLASEPKPHPSYTLNTGKTHWRSPEQVAKDAASYANRSKKA